MVTGGLERAMKCLVWIKKRRPLPQIAAGHGDGGVGFDTSARDDLCAAELDLLEQRFEPGFEFVVEDRS